jgi:hypothetical protein
VLRALDRMESKSGVWVTPGVIATAGILELN